MAWLSGSSGHKGVSALGHSGLWTSGLGKPCQLGSVNSGLHVASWSHVCAPMPPFYQFIHSFIPQTLASPTCGHHAAAAKSLQSCLTLCDPIDGSPPGSRVPGILQARTLEWVAISFSTLDAGKEDQRDSVLVLPELIMVHEETDAMQIHMQERLAGERTAGEMSWERNKLSRLAEQTGKYPKGGDNPNIHQQVNAEKTRSIHTVGYYPAVKRHEAHD